jgi:parallel beta-helix repeat protein
MLGLGFGILLQNSDGVTIIDNRLRGNSAGDLDWDGKGGNKIDSNACDTSNPSGACAH